MVATAHPLATGAGLAALRAGGSAVDAALAANAVLAVVEPVACGLGGDLFVLGWDAEEGRLFGLDASGRSPAGLALADLPRDARGRVPLGSPLTWTVPGAVDGWLTLHARWGRLPTDVLLADAIQLARHGCPVTEIIARAWEAGARSHREQPGFAEVFLPGGRAPREGELFRNPALARTLEEIAEGGADAFYRGRVADELVAFSERWGGALTHEDLAATRCTAVEPLSTRFSGHELWELPPAGQGIAALEMLNIAEAAGIEGLPRSHPDWWHVLVEAKKLAFADRARYLADPSRARVPSERLASKEHAADLARSLDRRRAAESPPDPPSLTGGETTYLAAADPEGNLVSWIQSNYTGFGSGHAVPSLGFGLQNRGALFSLDPTHPNRFEPGKRPLHTIIPGFVTRGGEPWLAFGVMGGDMQPQGHVQVLLNLLLEGMGLQEAGDAARFHHAGGEEPDGAVRDPGGVLHLEPGVPPPIRAELARRGHRIADRPGSYGGYQAVARAPDTGAWLGATECRKDGCALGF